MPIALVGTEFIAASTTAGTQQRPFITSFADGRFIAAWESFESSGGDGDGFCIRARIFNADGTPAGIDFVVNTTPTGAQQEASIVTFPDGRFLVTWQSADTGDGSEGCIRGRLYAANGTPEADDFIVNSTASLSAYEPRTTVLSDGRYVVTWYSSDTGDGSLWCTRARIFAADGTPEGNDFIVNTTTSAYQYEADVTALADGAFVVTFRSWENGAGTDMGIRARLYDGDGNAVGNDFLVETTHTNSQIKPSIATLGDGRFIVTWQSTELGASSPIIKGRIFDAAGTPEGDDFVINASPTSSPYSQPVVASLADGRIAVAWVDNGTGGGAGPDTVRAQILNADGTRDGDEFLVTTFASGDQGFPAIAALPDGRFIVTWDGRQEGSPANLGVAAQIFDPTVFTGTAGVDVWNGGNLADTISGADDNDVLAGLAGNDTLDGGSGADTMTGGPGDDTYVVDNAGDTVIEANETGTDTVNSSVTFSMGSQFIENLTLTGTDDLDGTGNDLANTLTGNSGNNALFGVSGSDTLNGGDGNDTLDGGEGDDTMTGGPGADVFVASTGNDVIVDFGSRYFIANASGANEVGGGSLTATGTGTFILNRAQTALSLSLVTSGLDFDGKQTVPTTDNVTGYHIHNADAGVNGPIVWFIDADSDTTINAVAGTSTALWTSTQPTTPLTPTLLGRLLVSGLYLNLHTTQFPGGAIRGQLIETGGSFADKIDLTAFNIGSFETWQAITADVSGSAVMTTISNGVTSTLTIQGVTEAMFTAADFIFAGNVAQMLNGTVNADDLFGAGGNDTLNGNGGADRLFGEADVDILNGGAGSDLLDGGTGADTMNGGADGDTYFVDNAGDTVTEANVAGVDTVNSSVSFALGTQFIENLTLLGSANINATGNNLANVLIGNSGNNTLNGNAAADTM